jgi:hypothetical protein
MDLNMSRVMDLKIYLNIDLEIDQDMDAIKCEPTVHAS